jgi:predicted Fe-Mo cluster-binding NifX family protein
MKIAIGTDDKKTIRNGHFGQSLFYRIVELINGEIVSEEYRDNTHIQGAESRLPHAQVEKIIDLLGDCSLFMAKNMGKTSLAKLAAHHVDCIITDIDQIDEAVSEYLYGKEDAFRYYDARKGELVPCSQRILNTLS